MKEWLKRFLTWLSKLLLLDDYEEVRKVHYVKCEPEFFNDVIEDYKTFELRKNDRDYRPGDDMVLREYDKELGELTGREERVSIVYMLDGYPGIEEGYCILGIERYF